jgi:NAD(P)-dependent dehydrogenase (short-subunit alcohol dehydrogenase family)
VVVLSRSKSTALAALSEKSLHFIQSDITQNGVAEDTIAQTVRKYGRLDSIILNAGALDPVVRLEHTTAVGWQECFNVNLFSNIPLVILVSCELIEDKRSNSSPSIDKGFHYPHFLRGRNERIFRMVSLLCLKGSSEFTCSISCA